MSIKSEKKNIGIFGEALRKRLHQKADEGYEGWDYDSDGRLHLLPPIVTLLPD